MKILLLLLMMVSGTFAQAKSIQLSMFDIHGHVYGRQSYQLPTKPGVNGSIVVGDLRCEVDSMSFNTDKTQHIHMTMANAQSESVFDGTIVLDRFFYQTLDSIFCKIEIVD